jgi:(2Fe-2S) ferredoxin
MSIFKKHIFVCENQRPDGSKRACCATKNSPEIRQKFKQLLKEHGLSGTVRANAAGCLDQCESGVSIVVYPEAVWYEHVTLADVQEIFDDHILNDRPVVRLIKKE